MNLIFLINIIENNRQMPTFAIFPLSGCNGRGNSADLLDFLFT